MRDIMGPLMRGLALGDPFEAADVTLGSASSPTSGPQFVIGNPDYTSQLGNPGWEDSFVGASGSQGGWQANGVIVDNSHNFGAGSFAGSTGSGFFLRSNSTQNFPGAYQDFSFRPEDYSVIDAGVFVLDVSVDIYRAKSFGSGGTSQINLRFYGPNNDVNSFNEVNSGPFASWYTRTFSFPIPAGTRSARLDLRMLRDGSGGAIGAEVAFDNVRMAAKVVEE